MTRAFFGYLGGLEARDGDTTIRLAGQRQGLLLALLLVESGRVVSTGRLAEELWGDDQPADPTAALRSQVSRLRRVLGPCADDLRTEPGGYRLAVEGSRIDARMFEDLVAGTSDEQAEPALELIDRALALWRGPALSEFVDCAFAQAEAVRLEELRASARERRARLLMELGSAGEAVADLRVLLGEHPLRESAMALLMEALYRDGRHGEALDAYRNWQRRVSDELGLEPSPDLQRVEEKILRHTLIETSPGSAGAHGVPMPVSSFVGRADEVSAIASLLERSRLVTLTGPGGVGKTRLALEVVRAVGDGYVDGVRFCDLVAVRRPTSVMSAVATAVGVSERGTRRIDDQLVAHVGARQMLIVLDNCEHVAAPSAAIAGRLVRECPNTGVLVTSQLRLGVDGEHVWPVAPLAGAIAVDLFFDRAMAADPSFRDRRPDGEAAALICDRLDGLPLAIELAAARARGTSLEDFGRVLDGRLALLAQDNRPDRRHRSLRAVVEWSFELLSPVEQRVFERLCVFAGRFDMSAAHAVASDDEIDEDDVTRALLGLVDRSLLSPQQAPAGMRYVLLETLRAYGRERLESSEEITRARERHAAWAVRLASEGAEGLAGPDDKVWADTLRAHIDDLREAHAWLVGADAEAGMRLVCDLHWFALFHSQSEIFRWAEISAAASADSRSERLPSVLASVAAGAWLRGDLESAEAAARRAFDSAKDVGSLQGRRALEALADVALQKGELDTAVTLFRRAYDKAREVGDVLETVWDLGSVAVSLGYGGRTSEAMEPAREALAVAELSGSKTACAVTNYFLGEVASSEENLSVADRHLEAALELAESAGCSFITGLAHVTLATLHARQGHDPAALRYFERAIGECYRTSRWMPFWVCMRHMVDLLERTGAYERAATLLGAVRGADSAPAWGEDEKMLAASETRLRERLGDAIFESCVDRSRSLKRDEVVATALSTQRSAEKGRVTTFMFTDIVSSTELASAMGDEAWETVMRWHDDVLRSLFAGHSGTEVKHTGDGFFVTFGDTVRAVGCAIAIQRALERHRSEHGFAPEVRIGLHCGRARRRGGDYTGSDVNVAARLVREAKGGEILATLASLTAAFPQSDPRSVNLRGVGQPVSAATVYW